MPKKAERRGAYLEHLIKLSKEGAKPWRFISLVLAIYISVTGRSVVV